MKKIIYLTIGLLIVSCSNESATSENPIEENQVLTQKFYFDGQYYNIKYQEDLNGNLSPFGELPATLKNLDNLPELATVVENDIIYFFTNEAEKFAFYGDDYNLLLTSRKQNDLSTEKNPALVGPFNLNVKFYQDSYLNGNVMSINSIDDLKNLKSVNFNDKASSCSITGSFRFPNGSSPGYGYDTRRRVIMYERVLRFLIIIFQPGYTGTKDLKVYPLLYSPTGTIKLVLLTLFNPTFLKLDKLN